MEVMELQAYGFSNFTTIASINKIGNSNILS